MQEQWLPGEIIRIMLKTNMDLLLSSKIITKEILMSKMT